MSPGSRALAIAATVPLLLAFHQGKIPKGKIPKGIDLERFGTFDVESRWLTYRDSVTTHRVPVADWVTFLEARRDFELLEWLAVYEGSQQLYGEGNPGEVLLRLQTPHWMRVALWNINQRDSHAREASVSPLEKHLGKYRDWARRFPEVKRLGGAALLEKAEDVVAEDASDQLRPLDPQTVILPFLDAPRQLPVLQPGTAFDKRKRYVHLVLRAIRAVSVAAVFGEPYRTKLLSLTRHANAEVRRTAMLEFSEFPKAGVPWSELLSIAKNGELPREDRRVALLAASFANHPAVYLFLHEVLRDPSHPGFEVSLSRTPGTGDGFTASVLKNLRRAGLPESLRTRIHRVETTLHTRLHPKRQVPPLRATPAVLLYRAAWAVWQKDRQGDELVAWTHRRLRSARRDLPDVAAKLRNLTVDAGAEGIPVDLQGWVRATAKAVLRDK